MRQRSLRDVEVAPLSRIGIVNGMKILIVGADAGIARCIADTIGHLGYEVTIVDTLDPTGVVEDQVIFLAGLRADEAADFSRALHSKRQQHRPIVALVSANIMPLEELLESGLDEVVEFESDANAITPKCQTRIKFLMKRAEAHELRWRTEDALSRSTAMATAVLETTVDGIITIDSRGTIKTINSAVIRIFGYESEELIGQNISILMPEPFHSEHDSYLQNYIDTGHRKIIGIGREVIGKRKDGSVFPLDLAVSEVRVGDERMFTGILRDISDRRRLEQEVLRITDNERVRIGQDLHDGLGQMLTGIGLISQNLAAKLETKDKQIAGEVAEISALVKSADQQARTLARNLTPVDLESKGLESALTRLALTAEKLFQIRCRVEVEGRAYVDDNTTATHLFRIAQEAISNAASHGNATIVRIELSRGDQTLRLRIVDNGVGFKESKSESGVRGMGVHIMNYRAKMIGGNLEITPNYDGGTTVTCTVRLDMIA